MTLFRRDPFFGDLFAPPAAPSWTLRNPSHSFHNPHHIHETDTSVNLSLDVPGIKAENLKVQIEDNVLRVSGERKTAGSEYNFVRSFSIDPATVNVDDVKANLDAGVLTLTVPKRTTPKTTTKSITVTESPAEATPAVTQK